jgi:glycolate oxidase FAD binding subunit
MPELLDLTGLAAGLETASVAWRELADEERDAHAVDGVAPRAICWPASYAEAAQALATADRLGLAVAPRGSGSKTALGNRPRRCDLIVSTERLNQIVEYAPANLTVTVEAGLSLAALQATLGESGQMLPLNPAHLNRATIGGIVATNASGPWRLGSGAPRDLVIGTRAATTSGTVVHAGGRVVKNVAGYDLNKLYVGSLGTLVLLVELSFKVAPKPAAQTTVIGRFVSREQLAEAARAIVRSPLLPTALEALNDAAARALSVPNIPSARGGYLLATLATAPGGGAQRQRDDLVKTYRVAGADDIADLAGAESEQFWTAVAETLVRDDPGVVRAKVSVPIGSVAPAIGLLEANVSSLGDPPAIRARAGSGVLTVDWRLPPDLLDGHLAATATALAQLRAGCQTLGGSLIVEECPSELKDHLDVWGDVGGALALMRQLKTALDPNGILNPGRFVGGI